MKIEIRFISTLNLDLFLQVEIRKVKGKKKKETRKKAEKNEKSILSVILNDISFCPLEKNWTQKFANSRNEFISSIV